MLRAGSSDAPNWYEPRRFGKTKHNKITLEFVPENEFEARALLELAMREQLGAGSAHNDPLARAWRVACGLETREFVVTHLMAARAALAAARYFEQAHHSVR